MSVPLAFQDESLLNLPSAFFAGQQASLTGPVFTQYFLLVPPPGENCLGATIEFSNALSDSATVTVTLANTTNILDECLDQLQVAPAPNADPRSYLTTRQSVEELERISYNMTGANSQVRYPRGAPHTYTATTGAATDTVQIVVPIGGPAAAVRVHVPNITGVYTASVTDSVTVTARCIAGLNGTVVSALEKVTPNLSTGKNDLSPYFPANMSPDYMGFVGEATATASTGCVNNALSAVFVTAQDGSLLVDIDTAVELTFVQNAVAQNVTYPVAALPFAQSLFFALRRKRFKTLFATVTATGTINSYCDLLFVEYGGTSVASPAAPAAPTAVIPASQNVGVPVAGGAGLQPLSGTGGAIGVGPGIGPVAPGAVGYGLGQGVIRRRVG